MNLVTRHLTSLTDFSGRENREPFWLWVLAVYVGQTVLNMVLMIPLQFGMQAQLMPQMEAMQRQQLGQGNAKPGPEQAAQMLHMMAPMFRYIFVFAIVLGLVFTALMAAAVVRRLHDGGRSGYWALPSLVISLVAQGAMLLVSWNIEGMFKTMMANPGAAPQALSVWLLWFGVVWLIGFVASVVLFVLLVLAGTNGPNAYGEDPLAEYRARQRQQYAAAAAAANGRSPVARRPATVVRPGERQWDDPA